MRKCLFPWAFISNSIPVKFDGPKMELHFNWTFFDYYAVEYFLIYYYISPLSLGIV